MTRTYLPKAAPSFTPAPRSVLQRKCACGGSADRSGECEECREKMDLQRKAAGPRERDTVPPIVHEVLSSSGQPLDPVARALMEPCFGHDFGLVRVHVDARAAESANAVHAYAYAVGRDIVFAAGHYRPGTTAGRQLLAHEIVHVVQQGLGMDAPGRVSVGPETDAAEREAQAIEAQLGQDGFLPVRASAPSSKVQRDLAIEPVVTSPVERGLSEKDIAAAIKFNQSQFKDPFSLAIIRDVIGISKYPAVSDRELALAVARWQASHGIAQDGRLGAVTVTYVVEELQAEGEDAYAALVMAEFPKGTFLDVDTSFCDCRDGLRKRIETSTFLIGEYQACGGDPGNKTGTQIEKCIEDRTKGKGFKVLGTTDLTGAISVAHVPGPCGPLLERITFAHEQVHAVHTRELEEKHGKGTKAFEKSWMEATDWVADEVNARQTNIAVATWALGILGRICP